ncbi:hypothetical protein, partial [Actinoallomurus sp. NPDC052274]|uniref:hypothetical protein n=1 Tax=Actinoallomurus sp. NPDC052274 TaxID=3155420 RepID=UPI003432DB9D
NRYLTVLHREDWSSMAHAALDPTDKFTAWFLRARGRVPDGPEREAGVLSVTVQWVAPDDGAAKALFAAARDTQNGARDRVRAGNEAYAIGTSSGTVVMRVGRTIVTVSSGLPDTATRLAAVIAARLPTAA